MNRPWSIWLEPCKTDRIRLQKLIKDVYAHFNSPVFDPHITLFGRVDADSETTFSFLSDCVRGLGTISLNMLGVKTAPLPWKTLYLQVDKTEPLVRLQKEIDQYLNVYRHYDFDPHLSLVYGDLDINKLEFDHISFPETITFSSVGLVYTPNEITEWQRINQVGLGGGIVL